MTTPAPNAAAQTTDPLLSSQAAEQLMAWRERYVDGLADPYGWWAISGLAWAEEGTNLLGSRVDAALPLPERAPSEVAWLRLEQGRLRIEPTGDGLLLLMNAGAESLPLSGPIDFHGPDLVLHLGKDADAIRVVVIQRFGRHGVRVYDPLRSAAREREAGVAWFPPQPGFVVEAEFIPPQPGETLPIVNLLGEVTEQPVGGRVRFSMQGQPCSLVGTPTPDGGLFLNFRDRSSGVSTYGAGRFLKVAAPVHGRAILDFHRAHHPPCAHTPYAMCPLPPLENRLPLAVEAGERLPG